MPVIKSSRAESGREDNLGIGLNPLTPKENCLTLSGFASVEVGCGGGVDSDRVKSLRE